MKKNEKLFLEKECPVCGKTFLCTVLHAYKDKRPPYRKVCSWSCVCKSEKLKEATMKRTSRKRVL